MYCEVLSSYFNVLMGVSNYWLSEDLGVFRFWYNQVRPHQNLDAHTPAEVWRGSDVFKNGYREVQYFYQWEGLLTGYYLPT